MECFSLVQDMLIVLTWSARLNRQVGTHSNITSMCANDIMPLSFSTETILFSQLIQFSFFSRSFLVPNQAISAKLCERFEGRDAVSIRLQMAITTTVQSERPRRVRRR